MGTYKGIQGESVEVLASDPSPTQAHVGKLWYNTTAGAFKIATEGSGAWAAGTNYPNGSQYGGSAGTSQNAALAWQGDSDLNPTPGAMKAAFSYDGSTWTQTPTMNRDGGSYTFGAGTSTSALAGSYYRSSPAANMSSSEEYNGTAWAAGNDLTDDQALRNGCGTQTAALTAGGRTITAPSGPITGYVEHYDGTTWTESTALTTARIGIGAHNGTQTASLAICGATNPGSVSVTNVESWNGTSWTAGTVVNTSRYLGGASGTSALALTYGGKASGTYTANTEEWNGTSWTEIADLTTARGNSGSAGTTNTDAILISGSSSAEEYNASVEEWTSPVYAVKTVTTS